jgi:hypothetical protein
LNHRAEGYENVEGGAEGGGRERRGEMCGSCTSVLLGKSGEELERNTEVWDGMFGKKINIQSVRLFTQLLVN